MTYQRRSLIGWSCWARATPYTGPCPPCLQSHAVSCGGDTGLGGESGAGFSAVLWERPLLLRALNILRPRYHACSRPSRLIGRSLNSSPQAIALRRARVKLASRTQCCNEVWRRRQTLRTASKVSYHEFTRRYSGLYLYAQSFT